MESFDLFRYLEVEGVAPITLVGSQNNIGKTSLLEALFPSRAIFKSTDFVADSSIPDPTARRLLGRIREVGLVTELSPGRGRRAAMLCFPRLLNIAEGREVF